MGKNDSLQENAATFLDHGIVGYALRGTSAGTATVAELLGMVAGGVGGAVTSPLSANSEKTAGEWTESGVGGGGKAGAKTVGNVLGAVAGVGKMACAFPTLAGKAAITGLFMAAGAIPGAIAGATRATFDF